MKYMAKLFLLFSVMASLDASESSLWAQSESMSEKTEFIRQAMNQDSRFQLELDSSEKTRGVPPGPHRGDNRRRNVSLLLAAMGGAGLALTYESFRGGSLDTSLLLNGFMLTGSSAGIELARRATTGIRSYFRQLAFEEHIEKFMKTSEEMKQIKILLSSNDVQQWQRAFSRLEVLHRHLDEYYREEVQKRPFVSKSLFPIYSDIKLQLFHLSTEWMERVVLDGKNEIDTENLHLFYQYLKQQNDRFSARPLLAFMQEDADSPLPFRDPEGLIPKTGESPEMEEFRRQLGATLEGGFSSESSLEHLERAYQDALRAHYWLKMDGGIWWIPGSATLDTRVGGLYPQRALARMYYGAKTDAFKRCSAALTDVAARPRQGASSE